MIIGSNSRSPLVERLGLPASALTPAQMEARLAKATLERVRQLAAMGLGRSGAAPPPTELPRSLAETLLVSAAWASSSRRPDAQACHSRTMSTALDALPGLRAQQLLDPSPRACALFHGELPWPRLPRLSAALDTLDQMLGEVDCGPSTRGSTLASYLDATHYGRVFPPFLALPHDLEQVWREADTLGGDLWAAVDYRLCGALVHEQLHFERTRDPLFPPLLDEAVAAWIGLRVDPAFIYPPAAAGVDSNGAGVSDYVQVGALLAHLFGAGPLLRAQAGGAAWTDVLPSGLLCALERQALELHEQDPRPMLTQDATRPDRVLKLATAAAAGEDVAAWDLARTDATDFQDLPVPDGADDGQELLGSALSAARLELFSAGSSVRVRSRSSPGEVTLDFAAGLARWEGGVHVLPPQLCAEERAAGRTTRQVTWSSGPASSERTPVG